MRKYISVLLIALLCFSLGSCSSHSQIKIDKLATSMRQISENLEFDIAETDNGYTFHYDDSEGVAKIEYNGKADKRKNIIGVEIAIKDFYDISILHNETALSSLLTKEAGDMRMDDIRACDCLFCASYLVSLIEGSNKNHFLDMFPLFTSGETITIKGWQINTEIDTANETVTICAYPENADS